MKSTSIDRYYHFINKNILLLQSYTAIPNLSFIIKACRLKPHPLRVKNKFYLCKWWIDEFNNSLKIFNKKIKLIYNDLSLRKNIVCSDLYYGLSLSKILKMSKLIQISLIKDDENESYQIITFLGIDNYLRSYVLNNSEYEQVSPLILGISNLKNIADNLDVNFFKKIKIYKNNLCPGIVANGWLSCLPVGDKFVSQLEEHHCDVSYF